MPSFMPFRPHQFRVLKEFLDSLVNRLGTVEGSIRRCSEAIYGIRNEKKAEQEIQIQREILRQISLLSSPKEEIEADNAHQERRHKENHKLQQWIMGGTWFTGIFTLLAFLAAAYYANQARQQSITMNRTYCEIQKQTTLLRQQIVGTQAAVIQLQSPHIDFRFMTVEIKFPNRGHVNGHLSGSTDVFRRTLDGDIKLAHQEFKDLLAPYQRQDGPDDAVIIIHLKKSDFSLSEITEMETDTPKEFLFLKGSFSYNDGFETPPSETPFCFSWIAYPPVVINPHLSTGGSGVFISCDKWTHERNFYLGALKAKGEGTTKYPAYP